MDVSVPIFHFLAKTIRRRAIVIVGDVSLWWLNVDACKGVKDAGVEYVFFDNMSLLFVYIMN